VRELQREGKEGEGLVKLKARSAKNVQPIKFEYVNLESEAEARAESTI